MSSPAHRAALGFLRGGLIAAVSLALTPALGAVAAAAAQAGWPARAIQFLLPLAGFAFGGAVGGEALGFGSRGAIGFGCGGGAAGLVLLLTAPTFRGSPASRTRSSSSPMRLRRRVSRLARWG